MARQRTVADFEEGTGGAPIPPTASAHPPLDPDHVQLDATYTNESRTGDLAARLLGPDDWRCVVSTDVREVVGGGGYMKIKSSLAGTFGDPTRVGDVRFQGPGGLYHGVLLRNIEGDLIVIDAFTLATVASSPMVFNQWLELQLAPNGSWSLSTDGGVVLSGVATPPEEVDRFVWSAYADNPGDETIVDDLWVWADRGPAVRLYPRDDGRGMSSAPRHWPPPKSRRIIGGYP